MGSIFSSTKSSINRRYIDHDEDGVHSDYETARVSESEDSDLEVAQNRDQQTVRRREIFEEICGDSMVPFPEPNSSNHEMFKAQGVTNFGSPMYLQSDGGQDNTVIGNQIVVNMQKSKINATVKPAVKAAFQEIEAKFRTQYGPEDTWIDRLPWMVDRMPTPDEFTMLLQIEGERDFLCRHSEAQVVKFQELLKPSRLDNSSGIPRSVIIRGRPGFGKTALCKALAYDWAQSRISFSSQYQLVVIYDLNDLPESAESLSDELVRFCQSDTTLTYEKTKEALASYADKILIFLDGYHCLPKSQRKLVDDMAEEKKHAGMPAHSSSTFGSLFRSSTLIVTSDFIDGFEGDHIYDRTIRIDALGDHKSEMKSYLKKFSQGDKAKTNLIFEIVTDLKTDLIRNISPLPLFIICYLFEKDKLPKQISEYSLYEAIVKLLCCKAISSEDQDGSNSVRGSTPSNGRKKPSFGSREPQPVSQTTLEQDTVLTSHNQSVSLAENEHLITKILDTLSAMFHNYWNNNYQKNVFDKEDIKSYLGEHYETVIKSGVLKLRGNDKVVPMHHLIAEFFVTRHLKRIYLEMATDHDRLVFLAGIVKAGKASTMIYNVGPDKKYLISRTRMGNIHFRWNVSVDDPALMSEASSFEMAGDNVDLFKYQFPDIIMVLFNKSVTTFPYSSTFFPAMLPGQRCLSLLGDHLKGVHFSVFFYQEIFKQTEGDIIIVSTKCFGDTSESLWKGKIFCYHLLPPEQFGLFNVRRNKAEEYTSRLKIKNVSIKRKFSLKKNDYNWVRDFLRDYLDCTVTIPTYDKDLISEGKFLYDCIVSLTTSPLFERFLVELTQFRIQPGGRPGNTAILNVVVMADKVVVVKANGQYVYAEMKALELQERKENLIGKLSFDAGAGIAQIRIVGKNKIAGDDNTSDSEEDD